MGSKGFKLSRLGTHVALPFAGIGLPEQAMGSLPHRFGIDSMNFLYDFFQCDSHVVLFHAYKASNL